MNKPFNIHDWQAKQKQLAINENLSNEVRGMVNDFIDTMARKYDIPK